MEAKKNDLESRLSYDRYFVSLILNTIGKGLKNEIEPKEILPLDIDPKQKPISKEEVERRLKKWKQKPKTTKTYF